MRNLLAIGLFVVVWILVMAACNIISILLGLEHSSLPAWWRQLVGAAIPIVGLILTFGLAWFARRNTRTRA